MKQIYNWRGISMNIYGNKVYLRAIEDEDLEFLRELQNSQEIEGMCGSWDFPLSKRRQKEWFESLSQRNDEFRLIIVEKESDQVIGVIYLSNIDWKNRSAFIGIKTIAGNTRGKGNGIDAIMALLRYAFDEMQLHRIESLIIDTNNISLNIMGKFGIQAEGIKRECLYSKGKYYDKVYVGLLENEYRKMVRETNYWGKI